MLKLSDKVQTLGESATLKMAAMANNLKASGVDVINMSLGEPDFDTPDFIKSAAKQAIDENWTHYTPVPGYLDLRQAICSKLARDNNMQCSPEQIVVSTGAKQSIANLMMSLINPGDKVLLPAPFWVSYKDMLEFFGAEVVIVPTTIENDFKLSLNQLEQYQDDYKLFLFSNPCNPTGSLYSQEEINQLAPYFIKRKHMAIISDEIYEYIHFDKSPGSFNQVAELQEQNIYVSGLSKGYAMTGWRLGYIAAPVEIAKACSKIQGQITSGANSIAQKAAISALNRGPEEYAYMTKKFHERRDLIVIELNQIEKIKTNQPQGAFYIFIDISAYLNNKIPTASELALFLLENVHLAATAGDAFGAPGHIRLSYATSEQNIIEAVKRLKEGLAKI